MIETQETDQYSERLKVVAETFREGGPYVRMLERKKALDVFKSLGFPTTRHEEWKYTSLVDLRNTQFAREPVEAQVGLADVERLVGYLPACRLVFVNGRYVPTLSERHGLPSTVLVSPLAGMGPETERVVEEHLGKRLAASSRSLVALNEALSEDGVVIAIPRGAVAEEPIHLIFLAVGQAQAVACHPRVLLTAAEGSQACVVELYAGYGDHSTFTNAVAEYVLAEGAVVEHCKVEIEAPAAFHIASTQIELARSANFTSQNICLGGRLVRNDIGAVLGGEGVECTLNGLYVLNGTQHIDNHTAIDHAMPHCNSHELYKGIMAGRSTGVFNGKIFVRQDAQKTDAKQTNQNLLLSEEASIDTKPQLEIYADDVRCTHGATVGQLDPQQVFYLRARGIGLNDARAMLTFAFASDIISRISVEPLRAVLEARVLDALKQ